MSSQSLVITIFLFSNITIYHILQRVKSRLARLPGEYTSTDKKQPQRGK